jgi:hypothetical protein
MTQKISEFNNGVIVRDVPLKVLKKHSSVPRSGMNVFKTLLTDGIELIHVVQFNKNIFLKFKEGETVKLSNFMPRESEKNAFWFKLNAKNLHLECNSA